jgi:putative flippase GtrA
MKRLLLFGCVGVAGAIVHIGGFRVFQTIFGFGNASAWLLAFGIAATVTWGLNRAFTFADRRNLDSTHEWAKYLSVAGAGAVAHFIVFEAAISYVGFFAQNPELAIVPGSLASFVVTYCGAALLVFRKARNSP